MDEEIINKLIIEGPIQSFMNQYTWLFFIGLFSLIFKNGIEKLVSSVFVFFGNDYKEDDVVYLNDKPARIVRIGFMKTTFFIYDIHNGKIIGGRKLVIQNEKLSDLMIEKPLSELDISRYHVN